MACSGDAEEYAEFFFFFLIRRERVCVESAAVLPILPLSHGQIAEQERREAGRQPYSPFIADGMLRMLLSLIGRS